MNRKKEPIPSMLALVCLLGCGGLVSALRAESAVSTAAKPLADEAESWPNFLGPNRNGVVASKKKLLDKWPEKGPKLVWVSGDLPEAPLCGISSPIACDGKVYLYAHTLVPLDGIFPFRQLLDIAGHPGDMPPDLLKAIDAARLGEERKAIDAIRSSDVPNKEEALKALVNKFLATLAPDQAKKYETVIRGRIGKGDKLPSDSEYKRLLEKRDLEVKTRQDFVKLIQPGYSSHAGFSSLLKGMYFGHAEIGDGFSNDCYKDQEYRDDIYCLEAATGKQLWKQSCPGNFESYGHDFKCSGTPAAANGKIFLRGSGGLHCLDAASGKVLWAVKGPPSCGSVVVAGDVVYCYMPALSAFDAKTGRELWQEPKAHHTFQTPALWVHGGKTYVLGVDGGVPEARGWSLGGIKVFCLDGCTGKIVWDAKGTGHNTKASPVVVGDVMTLRGEKLVTYSLSPEKATPLWNAPNCDDNCGTSAIIYNGHVYSLSRCYSDELFQVLDLKDGKVVQKAARKNGAKIGGSVSTPIITTSGTAFTVGTSDRGRALLAFKATPDKYEEVGAVTESPKKGSTFGLLSTVALADGRLYVRLTDAVACYDVSEAGQ